MNKLTKWWWTGAIVNLFALTPEVFFGRPADWMTGLNVLAAAVAALVAVWSTENRDR